MFKSISHALLRWYWSARKRWKQLKTNWTVERAISGKEVTCRDISRVALQCYVPLTQPLTLISEIQRSGGTLLSQLFDGHPECLAHPHELKIGYPAKDIWPVLSPEDDPDTLFRTLFERPVIKLAREGYRKGREDEFFLFVFLPSLQRDIFVDYLSAQKIRSPRSILDAYMTSFFNAWLNYQGLNRSKRIITGFAAGLSTSESNVAAFFDTYPDGKLISVIRDPFSWYASARRHRSKKRWFGTIESAIAHWGRSAEAMIRNKSAYNGRVRVIRFERLIGDTENVMRGLSEFAGITYHESLLTPTFNNVPIRANTSFAGETQSGILQTVLTRHQGLNDEEISYIEAHTRQLYNTVLECTD